MMCGKSKRPRSRPTKFTPENRDKILTAIRLGTADTLCSLVAGVAYNTFREWVVRGENDGDGEFYRFSQDILIAQGERLNRWLATIEKATQRSWQAAAWKLERLYPQSYGRTYQTTEHTGPGGSALPGPNVTLLNVNIGLSKMTDDELTLCEKIAKRCAIAGDDVPLQRLEGNDSGNGNGNGQQH